MISGMPVMASVQDLGECRCIGDRPFFLTFATMIPIAGKITNFLVLDECSIRVTSNWVLIYVGLEMQTFSILILLGRARGAYGLEGGLKYFILNGIFSGCLLLGLAYLYSQSEEVYMEGQMYLGLKFEWGYVFFWQRYYLLNPKMIYIL